MICGNPMNMQFSWNRQKKLSYRIIFLLICEGHLDKVVVVFNAIHISTLSYTYFTLYKLPFYE